MDLCEIYGKLVTAQKEPLSGVFVFSSCVEHVKETLDTSTGEVVGIGTYPVYSISNSDGSFAINLIKSKQYRIIIRPIGYDRVIIVPNDETANLWSLSGVSINEPVVTSTGDVVEDPQW